MKGFNLVKSLTRVINNSKGLLILCLITSIFGVNDVWGKGSSYEVTVQASPTGGGMVYVGNETPKHKEENKDPYKFSLSAQPNDNYNFKKWEKATGNGDIEDPTNLNTNISYKPENQTQYKATVTAIFTRMTTNVQSIAFGEKNVGTPYSSNITLTTGNAGTVTITLQNNTGNYFSITGDVGTYTSGGTEDTKNIVVNYEPKAAGSHSAKLQITGSNGMTTITIPLSGSAKSSATMFWNTGTNVMNVGDIHTEAALTYSDALRPIVFTTSDASIIKINDDGHPEAVAVGKATVTATQAETSEFYETSASQEITVTNKQKQLIEWTDKLSFKYEGSPFTQELTASAHTAITYSLSDITNDCVSLSGNVLTIKNYGTAYVTATAAETDEYIGVSMTRKVIIRDPKAACETIIYGPSAEHEFDLGWNALSHQTKDYDIDLGGLEPRYVNFDYRGKVHTVWPVDYYTGELQLYQYVNGGWSLVKNFGKPDKNNYVNSGNYTLDRKATKIRIRANDGMGYMYFNNLIVILAKYLEVSTNAISFDGQVGISQTKTFNVNYSDVQGPIEITSSNSDIFSFSPSSIDADCEQHGTVQITVTLNSKKEIENISETITISNGIESPLTINVSGSVKKRKQDINWTPQTTTYNSTDKPTLTATTTSELPISSYSSNNESIAKVVNGNQLEFYGSSKVSITAKQDGNDYYEPTSLTKEFTISKVTPTISTKPTPTASITYGQKLSTIGLAGGSATVNPFRGEAIDHTVEGSFAWTNGEYVVVETGGTTHEYDVTFTPSGAEAGMYDNQASKVTVTVNKVTPTLTAKNEDDLEVYVNDTQTPKLNLVDYITSYSAEDDTHGHTQDRSAVIYSCGQTGAVIEGKMFHATAAGTYTITATAPATDYYNSQTTTFTIKAINYYYSQAKSIVATNTTTGKDGGWVSVWQGNQDSASIGDDSWRHEDQTNNYKRLTETTHPYYFRAKVGTGYTFAGWFTSAEATEAEYTKPTYDAKFTISNRDRGNPWITRYAKFSPITYTVKFVGNGNTGGSMSDQTFTYDVAKNLATNGFTRTGWSFTGWKDGDGTTYTNGQEVTNLASTQGAIVTMTAQWSQDVYKVTLDPKGLGTGGTEQIDVRYNELIPSSITSPNPIDPAYIFLGYYLDVADESTKYYDADGNAVSGKKWTFTEGKTLNAKWQTGDYIKSWDVAESYTAQSNIPYDIAKSFSGGAVTYSIEGTDEGVITINNQNKYIYAQKKGTVTIKACPVLSEGYSTVSCDTHEITVVGKEQRISWNQSFSFTTQPDGSIDEKVPLNAKAIDAATESETGNPVWYSVVDANMAEIIGDATTGYSLYVKARGTGSTTITAHVDGTEVYESGELEFTIRIYKYGDKCHVDVMTYPSEKEVGLFHSNLTISSDQFSGAPTDSLYIQIKREGTTTGKIQIYASTNVGQVGGKDFESSEIGTDYNTFGFALASEDANKVEVKSESAIKYTVKDIRVTQKSYLRTNLAQDGQYYPIKEGIYVNESYSTQFTISYSAKHQVMWQITNTSKKDDWNLRIVGHTKRNQSTTDYTNDCDDWGIYTFELSTTHVWLTQEDIKDTITIKTSDGNDAIVIPIHLTVGLGATYQFVGGVDNNWSTKQNWQKEESTEPATTLPDMRNKVEIYAPVRITEPVTVYGLTIKENTATAGSVTIAPTGGLTVYNGGVSGLDNALTIESSQEHQGFFRMSPDANALTKPMPIATTQLATRSTLDEGANDDAVWQYIGTPAKTYDPSTKTTKDGLEFTVDYITWLYEWSEPDGWIDMKNVSQPVMLKPFTGYAITQYGQPVYEFTGKLINDSVRIPLTYTDEPGMLGDNVIANSYTSPIDVTLVDQTDFEGNVIQAFYVFNSGSYNQWKEVNKGGDGRGIQTGSLNNYAPGQYIAIPTRSGAALGENELTMIAPMQGFDIYATEKGKTAYFNLNYRKHVWNATNASGQMNEPLRAPKTDDTYMPDDVVRQYAIWDSINAAKQACIDAITHRVRLIAYGENSGNDRVVIIESPLYAKQYENGADAPKMFAETEGLLGLYTNEQDCGLMSVNATNSVDGMFVGFRAGSDSEYELSASNVIGQPLRLIDMQTQQTVDLTDSATYTFTAEPNSQDDFRFQIINQDIHVTPTGWAGLGDKAKIWYYKQTLYISDAAANSTASIYTATGELLKQVAFNHNTTVSTTDIPEGIYTIRVEDSVFKFFVKH